MIDEKGTYRDKVLIKITSCNENLLFDKFTIQRNDSLFELSVN